MGSSLRISLVFGPGTRATLATGAAVAVVVAGLSAPVAGAAGGGAVGGASELPGAAAQGGSPGQRGPVPVDPGPPVECDAPVLDRPGRGADVVRALGPRLAAVAARSGRTGQELAAQLRADRTLWVDPCGVLFFSDELPGEDPAAEVGHAEAGAVGTGTAEAGSVEGGITESASAQDALWPATIAPSDAFALHSRPGSSRVLYLDFDGHEIAGTAWNALYSQPDAWTAPPFSVDADPAFSDAEREKVIDVWRRVAQDYAPFDVDVTTQDPGPDALTRTGSTDTTFGTRVLISPDATQAKCGCGGRAYLNVFGRTSSHAYYQPAWVYPHVLSNSSKYIAEAASHEAGHTLNLNHDGTQTSAYYSGSGGWGPIMGSPYGQAITQWSNGSYPGANNTEDDMARISAAGAPLLADDVADAPSAAAPLAIPGSVTGLVGAAADVDRFSVSTAGGVLSASAEPFWPGPNLDIALTLSDPQGQVLASSAPVFDVLQVQASVRASISMEVAAGTYVLTVDGSGNGRVGSAGESEYGSVGRYTLTVTGQALSDPSPSGSTTSAAPSPTQSTTSAAPSPTQSTTSAAPSPTQSTTSAAPSPTQSTTSAAPTPTQSVSASPTPKKKPGGKPSRAETSGAVAALSVETKALRTAKRRAKYRASLVADGGTGPYTWRRVSGSLPKGLRMTRGGLITGKPKAKGTRSIRVAVTDSTGTTVRAWVRLKVR